MVRRPDGEHRPWQARGVGKKEAASVIGALGGNAVEGPGRPGMRQMSTQRKAGDMDHPEVWGQGRPGREGPA